jgi:hypothetical protein
MFPTANSIAPAMCPMDPLGAPAVEHGSFPSCTEVEEGNSCIATCDFGYAASELGKPTAMCQASGRFQVDGSCEPAAGERVIIRPQGYWVCPGHGGHGLFHCQSVKMICHFGAHSELRKYRVQCICSCSLWHSCACANFASSKDVAFKNSECVHMHCKPLKSSACQ